VEADIFEVFESPLQSRTATEERESFADRHCEHFGDVEAAEFDVEDFAAEACPFAVGAGHRHIGQKLHVDLQSAVSFARGAAPARSAVETEMPGGVVAD